MIWPLQDVAKPAAVTVSTGQKWLLPALLAAAAMAASSFRIVLAPGFELYLGPFFYLLAYRLGGLRLGLPVAVLTMTPTWLWWGHIFIILLALGELLFLDRVRQLSWPIALKTLLYTLTIGGLCTASILYFYYQAPASVAIVAVIRKMLNDVMLAALVDLALSMFQVNLKAGTISRRRHIELANIIVASVTFITIASTAMLFINNAREFRPHFALLRQQMGLEIELHLLRATMAGKPIVGLQHLARPLGGMQDVAIARRPETLRAPPIRKRLGCIGIEDGSRVSGPNDRSSSRFWVTSCILAKTRVAGRVYWSLYSTKSFAEESYRNVLLALIGPGLLLAISVLLELFIARAMRHSLDAWKTVVRAFGNQDIAVPRGFLFSEFRQPIHAIVAANNRFAALMAEREAVAKATIELKREMDLSLATEISFDEDAGTLSFTEISLDRPSAHRQVVVHPNDRMVFASQRHCQDAVAEFRVSEPGAAEWYYLVGRDLAGPSHWRSGWMVRLRQSKLAQDRMSHHARLVDLGGMASAISHELKQPLSTISLSAENGRILLDQSSPAGAASAKVKFDRIIEQVHRARDIIVRISRYARIEDDDPDPVDLAQVINSALTFMRPLLVQENVSARIDLRFARDPQLLLSRVGLEQIFVNAIQNSVDAIVSRRAAGEDGLPGTIDISASNMGNGLTIRIVDNGTGLTLAHADTAFDAFITTKGSDRGTGLGLYISRQIITEIGGRIRIRSRLQPDRGAELAIDLPPFIIASDGVARAPSGISAA